MEEPWLSHVDISPLFDNNTDSCVDMANIATIFTLQQNQTFLYQLKVKIVLAESFESRRKANIKVLAYKHDGIVSGSCAKPTEYTECMYSEGSTYFCKCQRMCKLVVKFMFLSESKLPSPVCEIYLSY